MCDVKSDPLAAKYLFKSEEDATPIENKVSFEENLETKVEIKKRRLLSITKDEETSAKDTGNENVVVSDSHKVDDLPIETSDEPMLPEEENQTSNNVEALSSLNETDTTDKMIESDESDSSFSFMTRPKKNLPKVRLIFLILLH